MKEGHIFTDSTVLPPNGEIESDYPTIIRNQIKNIGDVDTIVHHISSPGGSVYAAYEAFHILRRTGKKIISIVEGQAMSAATFMAAAGDEVLILNPSRWMIHNPRLGLRGDSEALKNGAEELMKIENEMAEVYARKSGKPVDEIKAMMKKETYMTAKEAVEFGFCDKVLTSGELIPEKEKVKLKAVALGTMETNTIIDTIKNEFASIKTKLFPAKAVELGIKGGGVLVVDGDVAVPGAAVTIDGAPAEGPIELEDGTIINCVAGVIESITPPAPAETPEQQMKKRITELEAQLAQHAQTAQQANKTQEELDKIKAEKVQTVKALAEFEQKLKELEAKPAGDQEPLEQGAGFQSKPYAFGIMRTQEEVKKIKASRSFLADHMPHLERHYKGGKYSDGTRFTDYRSGGPEAVSILETDFGYTWQGELTTDLFYTPSFSTPALSDLFTVDTGSKDKKRYNIVPIFNNVLKPYTGCDQAVTGSSFNLTDKPIQLKPFQMYESFCKDDFTNQLSGTFNHLAQEWLKTGNESFDPAGTPIDRIIVDALKDALRRDLHRRVIFADNGSSNANYNQIDGLFTTLKEQSGAQNYCVYANKTNFGTGSLAANAALTEFESMYVNSDALLKQHVWDSGKGALWVTRSLFDNYTASLRGVGSVTEQAFSNQQKGLAGQVMFNGVPVYPMTIWDSLLAESANPHTATTRHIAILGSTDNFILGVENTSDLGVIDSWFEKKDNKRYYRSNMTFGVLAPVICDLVTISY
jgi:ATP-dependent Clp protease, protease subunit